MYFNTYKKNVTFLDGSFGFTTKHLAHFTAEI